MPTNILLNPKKHHRHYPDQRSLEIMEKTIEFFETNAGFEMSCRYEQADYQPSFSGAKPVSSNVRSRAGSGARW